MENLIQSTMPLILSSEYEEDIGDMDPLRFMGRPIGYVRAEIIRIDRDRHPTYPEYLRRLTFISSEAVNYSATDDTVWLEKQLLKYSPIIQTDATIILFLKMNVRIRPIIEQVAFCYASLQLDKELDNR